MRYGRKLSSLLAEPWDLVHCWEEPYVAAAHQIARQVSPDVPLVFATFQNIAKRYPPPFNWIERYSMKRADGVIAFGQTIADVLARTNANESRTAEETRPRPVAVIPPGVDLSRVQAGRGPPGRDVDTPRLVRRASGRRLSRPLRSGKGRRSC